MLARTSRLDSVEDFIELFNYVLDYCCMKAGLLPYNPSQTNILETDLILVIETQMQIVQHYIDSMWLHIYDTDDAESIITVDNQLQQQTYVTKTTIDSPASLLKKFVVCVFTALRSIIEYTSGIKESEKACPHFLKNLLQSFGLYKEFFILPVPIHRKLARALVHLYKFKGSKYSAQLLLRLISFAGSYITELYSYRIGPQYDTNYENLYFEFLYKFGTNVEKFLEIHYRQVVDSRWYTVPTMYSKIFTID